MKKTKFTITGLSLNELYAKYGEGVKGFYSSWWRDEKFADEKPEAGIYEIDFENTEKYINLIYQEQKNKLPKGFDFPHPAVLAEIILSNPNLGFLRNYWSRTSSVTANRNRVFVRSGSDGFYVDYYTDGNAYSLIGVSASRKVIKI